MRYFAKSVFRERIHGDEIDGNLVRTEPPGGIFTQPRGQLWAPKAVHDAVGHHLFAIDCIGPNDDGSLADSGIARKHLFHPSCRKGFPSSSNDMSRATRD